MNHVQQTEPPSVAIIDLFPDGGPEGEIQEYAPVQDGYVILAEFSLKTAVFVICIVLINVFVYIFTINTDNRCFSLLT